MRQRGVDIQRLLRHRPAAVLGKVIHGAHVVQPVRQLHQHHPDVLGHRDQHLADVLGLGLFLAVEGDLLQLGDAGDELAYGRAETLLQVGDREMGVLHRVVQNGRREGVAIELEVGQDAGDGQGVLDEFLAREPVLVVMGAGGGIVGARQHIDVVRRQITDLAQKVGELHDPVPICLMAKLSPNSITANQPN